MIKIVFGFLFVGLSLFIAKLFADKLKRIYEIYDDLTIFGEKLYNAVEYYKDDVNKVAKEFEPKSELKEILSESDYLCKEVTPDKNRLKDLPKEERNEVIDYLNKIGKSDYETQINYVKEKNKRFSEEKERSFKKYKKMTPVYYKIAFLAGITVFIIIL